MGRLHGATTLPSLIFACNTNGHEPATNVPENGIELLQNHWTSQPEGLGKEKKKKNCNHKLHIFHLIKEGSTEFKQWKCYTHST